MNKLTYGGITYTDGEIIAGSGNLNLQHSMVGETLSVDTLSLSLIGEVEKLVTADDKVFVTADDKIFCLAGTTKAPPAYSVRAPGVYSCNDAIVGKYFLEELHQVSKMEYALTFFSAVQLLKQSKHVGGLYNGTLAGTVLASIMGDVAYTVDDDVAAVQVFGLLPYDWRCNNLQKLLMAIGGALKNAADGSLRVTSLSNTPAGTFGMNRVFEGGSLVDKTPATAVQVTEHNYFETTEVVTLFDGGSLTTETVIFDEPYHSLTITGNGTIVSSGPNYCTFTGTGSLVLTGKKYQHVTRAITEGTAPTGSPDDVVKSVSDNTLLTPNNATEVAARLYDFLKVPQSIKAEVVFGSERPGDVVSIVHPYTEAMVSATIKSMDVDIGRTELRANSEFLVGYTPPSVIAGFQNFVALNGSGNWTVPAGVTKIRAIILGGGDGGAGGSTGENGSTTNAGAGGEPGTVGEGGLIFETNITVTPGQVIPYSCGLGGVGGVANTPGSPGGETTFGTYKSSVGRKYPYGYYEPKSATTLAKNGTQAGVAGKNGSNQGLPGESLTYKGVTYTPGQTGATVTEYGVTAYGGYGGGAAAGANGGNGVAGDTSLYGLDNQRIPIDGKGGTGATAVDDLADSTGPGEGGTGGHGGGGGGRGQSYTFGGGGPGGPGSPGKKGGPGRIIVYF